MSDGVENLFETLRRVGDWHSVGSFSVDFGRARDTMRQYLLADRYEYVLKLVQHAIAADASAVAIESRAGRTRVMHDGRPPTMDEMADLLSAAKPGTGFQHSLRPLAVALNSALALPCATVRLSAWEESEGRMLRATADLAELTRVKGFSEARGMTSGVVAEVEHRPSLMERLRTTPECRFVSARCSFAPVHLSLNGHPVSPSPFGEPRNGRETVVYSGASRYWKFPGRHNAVEARLFHKDHAHRVGLCPSEATVSLLGEWAPYARDGRAWFPLTQDRVQPSSVVRAALGLATDTLSRSQIELIYLGVKVGVLEPANVSGLTGVVAIDGGMCKIDGLSVRDGAGSDLRGQLLVNVRRLIKWLRRTYQGSNDTERIGHALTGDVAATRFTVDYFGGPNG